MRGTRIAGVAVVTLVCACAQDFTPRSSGSAGLSADDSTLFVADADHGRISVIDTGTRRVLRHVPVGKAPERVLVAPGDVVFVTNRLSRSVSRIAADGTTVIEGSVGAEPVGMALSKDGRLYVANSRSGTLSVLDATTLERRSEIRVGGEPHALVLLPGEKRAYVTDFNGGQILVVDLERGQVTGTIGLSQPAGAECGPRETAPRRVPAQVADIVLSPDGGRAYVAHVQSRTGPAQAPRRRPAPGQEQESLAFAVAPALSTIDTSTDKLMLEPFSDRMHGPEVSERPGFPSPLLLRRGQSGCVASGRGLDAPSSLVVDGSGEWIYVADHNSNAVAVVSAFRRQGEDYLDSERGIFDLTQVGARPTGLAVRKDLKAAYVHNAFDYSISVVENRDGDVEQATRVVFSASDLPPEVDRGRRIFYSAVDPRLTRVELGGLSCSSCHPNGGTDGLSWVLPGRRGQPRNTPALWGVTATAPYHWDGMVKDMPAFAKEMVASMGGAGLGVGDLTDLVAYLAIIPAPDVVGADDTEGGRKLFEARCASCHLGSSFTDGQRHPSVRPGERMNLDTPSLRGVAATAPYLHDGSAKTLRDVLDGGNHTIAEHRQRDGSDRTLLESYLRGL